MRRGSYKSDENQMDTKLGARKGGDKCNKVVLNLKQTCECQLAITVLRNTSTDVRVMNDAGEPCWLK